MCFFADGAIGAVCVCPAAGGLVGFTGAVITGHIGATVCVFLAFTRAARASIANCLANIAVVAGGATGVAEAQISCVGAAARAAFDTVSAAGAATQTDSTTTAGVQAAKSIFTTIDAIAGLASFLGRCGQASLGGAAGVGTFKAVLALGGGFFLSARREP